MGQTKILFYFLYLVKNLWKTKSNSSVCKCTYLKGRRLERNCKDASLWRYKFSGEKYLRSTIKGIKRNSVTQFVELNGLASDRVSFISIY